MSDEARQWQMLGPHETKIMGFLTAWLAVVAVLGRDKVEHALEVSLAPLAVMVTVGLFIILFAGGESGSSAPRLSRHVGYAGALMALFLYSPLAVVVYYTVPDGAGWDVFKTILGLGILTVILLMFAAVPRAFFESIRDSGKARENAED
ncbi:hypothetical protein [Candidatus Poriferisocius sp.]|uniref:hypothetical protein n=1 Tax=Candidatus Poriferisocius sp. TaxID=3101276 RepID=UPI003B02962B